MPTADVLKAYYSYKDFVKYLFKPYIAITFTPIIKSYFSYFMSPLKQLQPNTGLLFLTNSKLFLKENPTIII